MIASTAKTKAISPAAAKRVGQMHLLDDSFVEEVCGVGSARGRGRLHFTVLRL